MLAAVGDVFKALSDPTRREGRYKFHDLDTSPLREIADRWPVVERPNEPKENDR